MLVNNGFHIQADEFENFKKYLDDNGAYISRYQKYEIPFDQQKAVFNEMNIGLMRKCFSKKWRWR